MGSRAGPLFWGVLLVLTLRTCGDVLRSMCPTLEIDILADSFVSLFLIARLSRAPGLSSKYNVVGIISVIQNFVLFQCEEKTRLRDLYCNTGQCDIAYERRIVSTGTYTRSG